MFKKILIANRGEIAVRIIRACQEMGISTVAVYSEADKDSLHVRFADEAFCIGPPISSQSYLNIPAIISAAEVSGAEAVHPGYGFLAENADFASICESHKITFIGPSPEAIRKAGAKSAAREVAMKNKIPVVPGSKTIITDEKEALKTAQKIGFPVIVKACGGGGGRGMRIVTISEELSPMIKTAQAEAQSAFGRSDVYLEKYIEEPRHIEFQILADNYGNCIHLGERDCSIQRRHQKLIEESPSPYLNPKLRSKMGAAAIKLAKAAGYSGAGTVEFLVDNKANFYFIEVNTRLQVEHGVTEEVTGIDIVKEQIKIASGAKLNLKQKDIKINGWAIEFRINAEDWERDFLPNPGTLSLYLPPGGPGVRVDSHAFPGYVMPPYYDSLLAKLIVYAKTRSDAISRAQRALSEFVIDGVSTLLNFHKQVVLDGSFRRGDFSTSFITKKFPKKNG
jgi:acetyl-CoA carboxylase biotin carboxylase subunit